MPELPDVTVYVEALQTRVIGHELIRALIKSPFLLRTADPPLSATQGRTVQGVRRLGKQIAIGVEGDLWLDGETGTVVRQSGYLVKKPSIFVKRVDVTRELALRDGITEMRITHLSVDTRLVGRAELTIQERPVIASDGEPAVSIAER